MSLSLLGLISHLLLLYTYFLFENFQSTFSIFHNSYKIKNINQTMQQTVAGDRQLKKYCFVTRTVFVTYSMIYFEQGKWK